MKRSTELVKAATPPIPPKGGDGFKCKTCNKQFLSFQALGGHRASHEKQFKLMGLGTTTNLSTLRHKPKTYMCPICGLQFTIGQALGGHMRKHRSPAPISNAPKRFCLGLDLNLTPYENHLNLNSWTPLLNLNHSFL